MRKKAARLTCAVARYMQPFGGFQYGQMAPADDAAEQSGSGGGRGEGGEMRPFSPALARPHSLSRPLAERRPLFELAAEDLFPATIPSIASCITSAEGSPLRPSSPTLHWH